MILFVFYYLLLTKTFLIVILVLLDFYLKHFRRYFLLLHKNSLYFLSSFPFLLGTNVASVIYVYKKKLKIHLQNLKIF